MVTQPTLTRCCILFLVWVLWGSLLLLAGAARGADDTQADRERKAKAAIAVARSMPVAKHLVPVAPPPHEPTKKDYATGHKESIDDARPLVVFVGCEQSKVEGAITCEVKSDTFGSVRGPAVVVGYPQGDRLFVDQVLACPADPEKVAKAVKDASRKIDAKGPARQMPAAPKPLNLQIRADADPPIAANSRQFPPIPAYSGATVIGYQRVCNGNGTCSMVPVYSR